MLCEKLPLVPACRVTAGAAACCVRLGKYEVFARHGIAQMSASHTVELGNERVTVLGFDQSAVPARTLPAVSARTRIVPFYAAAWTSRNCNILPAYVQGGSRKKVPERAGDSVGISCCCI